MKTRWQIFCMILWHVQHGYPFLSEIYLVIYLLLDPKKTSRHNSCGERCLIGIFLGSSHTFSAGGPGCLGDDGFLPPPKKNTRNLPLGRWQTRTFLIFFPLISTFFSFEHLNVNTWCLVCFVRLLTTTITHTIYVSWYFYLHLVAFYIFLW